MRNGKARITILILVLALCLSVVSVPAALASGATLSLGTKSNDVKSMKILLYKLGYLSKSKVNTKFDSTTQTALRYFQVTAGIEPTGVADSTTRARMTSSSAPKKVKYTALKKGKNHTNVQKMETKLASLGYLEETYVDKKYTTETVEAVKLFQKTNGIPVSKTGAADVLTLTYIFSPIAKVSAKSVAPSPTPSVDADGSEGANVAPTPTPWPTTFKQLKYGLKKNSAVRSVQMRLMELGYMDYVADPAGNYTTSTRTAVEKFQKQHDLKVSGKVISVDMQQILFSDTAYPFKIVSTPSSAPGSLVKPQIQSVISVDWYGADRSKYFDSSKGLFSVGSIAIVTDIDTGTSFYVRRKGGLNHADVEPLTAFDTWQMYRVYKQKWSWARRAVYVTIGDVTIAASINGMPHDSSTIKTNNMDGHVCIHFTGSKTHGTKRVDSDHQSMVKKAQKASIKTIQKRIDSQK